MGKAQADLISASGLEDRRRAAVLAIWASSTLDESIQRLQQTLDGSRKVAELAHLLEEIGPAKMEVIRAVRRAAVMMVTSLSQSQSTSRCRELGITQHLKKPVSQTDLLRTILGLLGRVEQAAPVPLDQVEEKREAARHILLAEDNTINQKVATTFLQKMGHSVVVAANGQKALQALEKEAFDLVLMDVQMPEMDGFAATAAIRAHEQTTGNHISIIAMTAHAMKGDRERRLDAGMDDYISKPINQQDFKAAIQRSPLPSGRAKAATT